MGSRARAPGMVYPKVKVREQPDANPQLQQEIAHRILEVIESLSLEDRYPSNIPASKHGNNHKSASPLPSVGISSACLPCLSTPSICNGSEGRNKISLDQEREPNIRASSVPRPRAVLSSPDNDSMIGHQNRLSSERKRLLKRQTLRESGAGQRKPTLKNFSLQSPVNTRDATEVASNTNHPKNRHLLAHEKPQGQSTGKGKSHPVWI